MSAALGLYRLQQVDSQIDHVQARQKWIRDTLQNDANLRAATQAFTSADSTFKAASQALKLAEDEVTRQRIKIEQTESSLYGGSVRNPKELQDLQKDIVSLKKHLETLEERQLEAMLRVESAEQELQAAQTKLEQTQAQVNEQNRDLSKENESLGKDMERLETEHKAVMSTLANPAVDMYDQLRKQRRGVAVTTISDSACAACGTNLSPSQQQNARSSTQLITCPTCGRILYAS